MFENKKVNMAISIVVAALIWAYVIGSINPPAESRFRNIPVTLTNAEILVSRPTTKTGLLCSLPKTAAPA